VFSEIKDFFPPTLTDSKKEFLVSFFLLPFFRESVIPAGDPMSPRCFALGGHSYFDLTSPLLAPDTLNLLLFLLLRPSTGGEAFPLVSSLGRSLTSFFNVPSPPPSSIGIDFERNTSFLKAVDRSADRFVPSSLFFFRYSIRWPASPSYFSYLWIKSTANFFLPTPFFDAWI